MIARRALRLKTRLLIAFLALISGSTLATVAFIDGRNQQATLELVQSLLSRASETVTQRTVGFMSPARDSVALLAEAITYEPPNQLDSDRWVGMLASTVSAHPQIEGAFIADEHGRLVQVIRGAGTGARPSLMLRRVVPGEPLADETFHALLDPAPYRLGERLSHEHRRYDPRTRPWYLAAKAGEGVRWTEPYVFSTTRRPGVTAVQWVSLPWGDVVIGADIPLDTLSDFLRDQQVGPNGRTLIVSGDRVVAHPEPGFFERAGAEALPGIEEAGVDGLAEALERARQGKAPNPARERKGRALHVASLPIADIASWDLVVSADTSDFLQRSRETRRDALMISVLILALTFLFAGFVSRDLSRPMESLARKVDRVRTLRFDNNFSVDSRVVEVLTMSTALAGMQAALQSFARFAPANLVQQLMASGEVARLGGEHRVVSVLFSDIQGYSTLTERMDPSDVVELLNAYFSAMQEVIEAHHGVALEYAGDAILVAFGAPLELAEHAEHAARCALAMVAALGELNADWDRTGLSRRWKDIGVHELRARVGVHTGEVVAGNLGSRTHMKYGIVGDTVNVAARLETLNKDLGTSILISEQVAAALPEALRAGATLQGEFHLRGRDQEMKVYSLRATE